MSDLDEKEQTHVRTAMLYLRVRTGAWAVVAKALGMKPDSVEKVANGRRPVTPAMVFRVARFAEASIDDLLSGRWLPSKTCRHCGHPLDDFADEPTAVEDAPRADGPKLVR